MPVYMRKDQSWTPASLDNETFCLDDGDFIQDPDQHRDQLPQPYRMIDKVLGGIVDTVWDHISDRESERIADASRYRAPQYECAVHVQDDTKSLARTECMSQTPDGRYIVVGLENGLAVIRAESQTVTDVWADDALHVTALRVSALGDDQYLVITTDDMGAAKIFAVAGEQIYSLTSLSDSDASNKVIVSKVEVSSDGDFVAIFVEKPSAGEGWVEVHRCPREAWTRDLERLASKAAQQRDESQQGAPPSPREDTTAAAADTSQTAETTDANADTSVTGEDGQTRAQSRTRRQKSRPTPPECGWHDSGRRKLLTNRAASASMLQVTKPEAGRLLARSKSTVTPESKHRSQEGQGQSQDRQGTSAVDHKSLNKNLHGGRSQIHERNDGYYTSGQKRLTAGQNSAVVSHKDLVQHRKKTGIMAEPQQLTRVHSDPGGHRSRSRSRSREGSQHAGAISRKSSVSRSSLGSGLSVPSSKRHSRQKKSPSGGATQRSSHSFTATSLIIKVLPPGPATGSASSSVSSAVKQLDTQGEVLGTGAHHLLTAAHLDQRTDSFSDARGDDARYIPQGGSNNSQPTMHFLRSGRILSHSSDDTPTAIAIWWTSDTQLSAYSLHKTAKDVEHKPSLVLPMSAPLTASDVSPDGSQMALVMDNNNLVVWDMYLGSPKGVVHLPPADLPVTSVTFLDPCVTPQAVTSYPPYPTVTAGYLLVARGDGRRELVNVAHLEEAPQSLDLDVVRPDERPSLCAPVDGIPDLLVTCRHNGRVYLHDGHRGNALCEVCLPPGYTLSSPWQPAIAVGNKGGMLYLKGSSVAPPPATPQDAPSPVPQSPKPEEVTPQEDNTEADETPADEVDPSTDVAPPESRVFVFTLRSFPALDKYRGRPRPPVPFTVHTEAASRVDALFSHRLSQQPSRVSRLQSRWGRLRDEVATIKQLRADRDQRGAYSAASIAQSVPLVKSW